MKWAAFGRRLELHNDIVQIIFVVLVTIMVRGLHHPVLLLSSQDAAAVVALTKRTLKVGR